DGTANAVNENAANGTAVGITAAASDADATTNGVTFSLTDDAGGRFAIDANTGVVTVADGSLLNHEAAASHNITVRATSVDGSTADTTFTIHVNDVDEFDVTAPADADGTANAVNENAANGTAVGITAAASDADATTNAIAYSLDDDAGGRFAVDATSGVLRVAGSLDYESAVQHTVVVRATSADGSFALQSYMIAITPVNDLDPTIVSDGGGNSTSLTVVENQSAVTQVLAVDADLPSPALSYSLAGGVDRQFFHVDATTGIVTFLSAPNFESPLDATADNVYEVVIQVSDGSRTDSQQLWITVIDVNEAPLLDLDANDSSGAAGIDYRTTFVEGGTAARISDTDLALSDPDNVTLTSLTITLLNAQDGSQEGLEFDTSGTMLAGHYDSTTTTLTITGTDTLDQYAAVLRSIRYYNVSETPDNSERWLTVVVYDGNGFSDSATAVVSITAENDLPVAGADHYETNSGAALVVNDPGVLANDMDVDGVLTAMLVRGPANGTILFNTDGSFVYQPQAGFVGQDVFTYQVMDDRGGAALATVSISVAPVQAAPSPGSDGGGQEQGDESAPSEESEEATNDSAAPEEMPAEPAAIAGAPPPPTSPTTRAASEPTPAPRSDGPMIEATGVACFVVDGTPADAERSPANDPSNASGPFLIEPTPLAWREFAWAMQDQELWQHVDEAVAKAHSDMAWQHLSVGVASAVSLSVSTGYVVWVLRGSFLAASLLSSVPAWACIDPLPVLSESGWKATIANWDQESLADIVSHSTTTGD
ncbi:MAG: cadherin domain-containing protein, partial [Pirellulaceae bacterium]